jgi:hypothetical protein
VGWDILSGNDFLNIQLLHELKSGTQDTKVQDLNLAAQIIGLESKPTSRYRGPSMIKNLGEA